MRTRTWMAIGGALAGVAVLQGAFGAHALAARLEVAGNVSTWETAVRYQVWHGLAIVLVALVHERFGGLAFTLWTFLLGALFFSGSLFGLALEVVPGFLGPATPVGGGLLIAGWAAFVWRMLRRNPGPELA